MERKKEYIALMDTGATNTSITEEVARELNLNPTCKKQIMTAGEPVECNEYDIQIAIPVEEILSYKSVTKGERVIHVPKEGVVHVKSWDTSAVGMPKQAKHRGFDCLLGMDVLRTCSFQYSAGMLTICF